MKNSISFLFLLLIAFACSSKQNTKEELDATIVNNPAAINAHNIAAFPKFKFETDTHDFGTVNQGEKVVYTFKFTNIGKSDLIINDAVVSCGCTVPKYAKDPVKPGKTGEVEVMFNTTGKKGMQYKTIQLFANTMPNVKEIRIKAMVEEAK